MNAPEIERLIQLVGRLPGLGPRSARRIVLRLLSDKEQRLIPLIQAMADAATNVQNCRICGTLDGTDPCAICADPTREPIICVVESVADLWALERSGLFRGRYHVLGGLLSPIAGRGPDQLRIAPLLARLADAPEIILALPSTVEGQASAHYLAERLKPVGVRVTRLAQGVPVGGAIDILDDGTLALALSARREA
ncbi:MAG TPA: recombination mediator RecR [Acidiphilium sp.]|nr:MAG: recombination protein RecR [Acidiphilium sp. 21-60-14]OYV91053.1 MAG: recombination protein RecR [Acidiphilium sp. 37-60-79]OZB40115.1 MAG: recombination protein RecR [Acidiphilium sp. 34-60-192]HQT87813.1 recombination mediator RecR [Acidiphilium sp.]HQU23798.1 recombination mediator RecR [Acidiphilium sp.]